MGLVSVLMTYFVLADIGVVWAVLLAVGVGTLCGLLNGVLTVCLKLPAFIVTIGTQQIFSGLAYLVFNSPQKVFTDPDLQKIGKISISIFFGVLLLRMITNGMNLLGVQTYWQMLIKGLILVLALIVDVLESRKK